MKATAYVRWSSDEQTDGHSLQRQTKNVQVYADRVGLTIAETLVDEGFSAFKGAHISKGKLGRFLVDVDKGLYRGTALIVEHIDRLDRRGIEETRTLLARILNAGVEIHVTQENRVIRDTNDFISALLNLVGSHGATEYSRKLRERVSDAWRKKKHNGANGISISRKLPGWLKGAIGEPIRVNDAKAAVVRRIFDLAINGMGARMIAATLNAEGVPPFGGGRPKKVTEPWIRSYVQKILANRAVLGEYQPRKGGKPDGDVRDGFFPAVIDLAVWQKARDVMSGRRTEIGNGRGGRIGKVNNLFTGLVWDATGAKPRPMHFQDKGNRSLPKLATETTDHNSRHAIRYGQFEKAFLRFLDQLDWTSVLELSESSDILEAEKDLARLIGEIAIGEKQVKKLTDIMAEFPTKSIHERALAAEAKLDTNKTAKDAAEKRLETLRARHRDLLDESIAFAKLSSATDLETRAKLREEIRRKVARIDFQFSEDLSGNKVPVGRIQFVNGAVKYIAFSGGKIFAMSVKSE
jgi:DNA invertase Pin-like site-specific DNA recombinase